MKAGEVFFSTAAQTIAGSASDAILRAWIWGIVML
jgi:hypothetical protein